MYRTLEDQIMFRHAAEKGVQPRVGISAQLKRFSIKTVDSFSELDAVLKLRHRIFCEEYGRAPHPLGYDIDRYDFICDHVAIWDEETRQPVGTYRLISSRFSDSFYSQEEFHLEDFLSMPGNKLELGRACIHPDFRKGSVLSLLWKGIAEYARATDSRYLFGCSSIKTEDLDQAALICKQMRDAGHVTNDFKVRAKSGFRMPDLAWRIRALEGQDPKLGEHRAPDVQIPPLLYSYLRAGAKLSEDPALDRDFHCIDFFTVLRTSELSRRYDERYQVC